jgi:uncharacterized membrane protein YfcA
MSGLNIAITCAVACVTSVLSVSVGGTSLITVPLLLSFQFPVRPAIATNKFALLFLSISGAIGFGRRVKIPGGRWNALFIPLTVAGSLLGARLVLTVNETVLTIVIVLFVLLMTFALLLKPDLGITSRAHTVSAMRRGVATLLVFLLAIYGGFFSGGYVTVLTSVFILLLGFDFLQAATLTKMLNVFSSITAAATFFAHQQIDFTVGIPLGLSMALGAAFGTKLALEKGNRWVRALFLAAVLCLSAKILLDLVFR